LIRKGIGFMRKVEKETLYSLPTLAAAADDFG
jgi:hypothetical protein